MECLTPESRPYTLDQSNRNFGTREYAINIISILKPTICTNVSNLSGWFYYRNNITMHSPMNVKKYAINTLSG
jgi:hypothetical protein